MKQRHLSRWIGIFIGATVVAASATSCSSSRSGVSAGAGGAVAADGGAGGRGARSLLVSAELVSGTEVKLTFSDDMASPDGVDPTAFRLSAGIAVAKGTQYFRARASYYGDVHGHYATLADCNDLCTSSCACIPETAPSDVTLYYDLGAFATLEPGVDAKELVAKLAAPLGSVDPTLGASGPCGDMFLHYAEAAVPVEDAAGNPLAEVAPAWAAQPGEAMLRVDGLRTGHPLPVDHAVLDPYCANHGCTDGLRDGREGDTDCGGACSARCALGQTCNQSTDCASSACVGGTCTAASCTDGVQNQGESGVDCGGSSACPRCPDGTPLCSQNSDCAGGACLPTFVGVGFEDMCQTVSCSDATKDQGETGIDCGGPCAGCVGDPCTHSTDCASETCIGHVCAPTPATAIAAGGCAITGAGLKCWGDGHTTLVAAAPIPITALGAAPLAVAVSLRFSCAIDAAGQPFCWGDNSSGQLGDGTTHGHLLAAQVSPLGAPAIAIAASHEHACAVMRTGALRCWGSNTHGELGDGTLTMSVTPVDVSGLRSGVIAVAAGSDHTCALTSAGGVKCWGSNASGQLGDGTTTKRTTPVDVTGLASGVVGISAGGSHTCALTGAGGLKCWGDNQYGELGDGTTAKRTTPVDVTGLTAGITRASAGAYHTCAVTSAGAALCWGDNTAGEIGDGTTMTRKTPTAVSGLSSGVVAISTNPDDAVSCALTDAGRVLSWGSTSIGQIGDGSLGLPSTQEVPVEVYGL